MPSSSSYMSFFGTRDERDFTRNADLVEYMRTLPSLQHLLSSHTTKLGSPWWPIDTSTSPDTLKLFDDLLGSFNISFSTSVTPRPPSYHFNRGSQIWIEVWTLNVEPPHYFLCLFEEIQNARNETNNGPQPKHSRVFMHNHDWQPELIDIHELYFISYPPSKFN